MINSLKSIKTVLENKLHYGRKNSSLLISSLMLMNFSNISVPLQKYDNDCAIICPPATVKWFWFNWPTDIHFIKFFGPHVITRERLLEELKRIKKFSTKLWIGMIVIMVWVLCITFAWMHIIIIKWKISAKKIKFILLYSRVMFLISKEYKVNFSTKFYKWHINIAVERIVSHQI